MDGCGGLPVLPRHLYCSDRTLLHETVAGRASSDASGRGSYRAGELLHGALLLVEGMAAAQLDSHGAGHPAHTLRAPAGVAYPALPPSLYRKWTLRLVLPCDLYEDHRPRLLHAAGSLRRAKGRSTSRFFARLRALLGPVPRGARALLPPGKDCRKCGRALLLHGFGQSLI